MPLIDPRLVPDMVVCRECGDVVGGFVRHDARPGERGPFVQRGRCALHAGEYVGWPGFDFDRWVELCLCCAVHPLRSGSRFSIWFCDDCRRDVLRLNRRHGRCVVPIGRHSFLFGAGLGGEQIDDPIATHIFIEKVKSVFDVEPMLVDWRREAVRRNLDATGERRALVPISEYHAAVLERIDSRARFLEMCDYLAERARQAAANRKDGAR